MGALVRGLKRDDVRRGHVLAKPNTISMHNHFVAQVRSQFTGQVMVHRSGHGFQVMVRRSGRGSQVGSQFTGQVMHGSQVRSWFTNRVIVHRSCMVHRSGHGLQVRSWLTSKLVFLSSRRVPRFKRACFVSQCICLLRWFLIRSFVLMVCFEWQAFSLRDSVACGCSAGCIGFGCFCLLPSVLRSADSMTY